MPSKLDRDFSKIVEKFLKDQGVEVVTGEKVVEIGGFEGDRYVAREDKVFRGDFVVAATGFKPYMSLAA